MDHGRTDDEDHLSSWSDLARWLWRDKRRIYRLACIVITVLASSTLGAITGLWLAR